MAAVFTMFSRSAPENPTVILASLSTSTELSCFIFPCKLVYLMNYSKQLALLVAVVAVTSVVFFNTRVNQSKVDEPTLTTSKKCLDTLPYNVWKDPQIDYYNWYGLEGTSIHGTTYLTGHIFERHIAVNGACTLYQKQNNKTVFYNLNEFQKAASSLTYLCPV